jgi:hypothetical protein
MGRREVRAQGNRVILEIERFAYTPQGTFGRLKANGFECFTIEEVWKNNQKSVSCIPCNVYTIKRGQFPKHGEAFEILNVPNRSAILIHPANTTLDIEGCVGPGESLGYVNNQWAVTGSRLAYEKFMIRMQGVQEAKIRIYNYLGGML